jgi:hypothetical protein
MNNPLQITVNGVEFQEVPHPFFLINGEEDKFPFMHSKLSDKGTYPARTYKSLSINGRFFAPIINEKDKTKHL